MFHFVVLSSVSIYNSCLCLLFSIFTLETILTRNWFGIVMIKHIDYPRIFPNPVPNVVDVGRVFLWIVDILLRYVQGTVAATIPTCCTRAWGRNVLGVGEGWILFYSVLFTCLVLLYFTVNCHRM